MLRSSLIVALILWASILCAGELYTKHITTSGFACNDTWQEVTWTPERTIKIKSSIIWIGVDYRTLCDVGANLIANGQLINTFGWDHYASPTGIHQFVKDFGQDWMTVQAGSTVLLQSFCASFNGRNRQANVGVTIYYTVD